MSKSSTRAPSIVDDARVAGVSVPTVSRVINGSVPVSAEHRDRVVAAIKELGYRPNSAARALVTGRPAAITVLASNTTTYGSARVSAYNHVRQLIAASPDCASTGPCEVAPLNQSAAARGRTPWTSSTQRVLMSSHSTLRTFAFHRRCRDGGAGLGLPTRKPNESERPS